jgi:hypothetical protein
MKREAELRAENDRLRELYENVVGNRERFGWTINHLLECEEALRCAEQEAGRLRAELAKQEAVLVAADRVREAYEAMIEGRNIGRLPEWQASDALPGEEES